MDKKFEQMKHKTSVGGQALIEGIMMRGPKGAAVSVRVPDGSISTEMMEFKQVKDRIKFLGLPVIRGVVSFIETLLFGYKCLMYSAEKSGMEDLGETDENSSRLDKWLNDHMGPKVMNVITVIASVLGVGLAILLFMYLPSLAVDGLNALVKGVLNEQLRIFLEGIIRIIIFIAYMMLVSLMKDIKRTFMYHGAEHKTIFCYENGLELTVENVKKQSRFHPRCGTSFMFVMIFISIIISLLISLLFPGLRSSSRILWVLIKLLVMPVVMGLGYEFIRYAGKHENAFVKIVSAPGLWMQRITTKEPDDGMMEVAIEAFKAVITENPEDDAVR